MRKKINFLKRIAFFLLSLYCSECREIKVAFLMPWTGDRPIARRMAEVIPLAIENINNNDTLLQDHNLTFVWRDTKNDASTTLWEMAKLWKHEEPFVDAFIGPGFSVICKPTGLLAKQWNLPMISWACSDFELSDKDKYPTFARTKTYGRTNPSNTSIAMANVMKHFEWKTAAVIYSEEIAWMHLALEIKKEFARQDIHVTDELQFDPKKFDSQQYGELLKKGKETSRVFILLCYVDNGAEIIIAAKHLGLANGDYAFITSDVDFDNFHGNWSALELYKEHNIMDGVLDVSVNPTGSIEFQNLSKMIKQRIQLSGSYFYNSITDEVSDYAAYVYDAVTLYALALNDTISQGGNSTDGRNVTENMFGKTFNGISGLVTINQNGDRQPAFELRNIQNGSFVRIASITSKGLTFRSNKTIVWIGGGTETPKDKLKCGIDGTKCSEKETGNVALYISFPIALLVLVFGIAIGISLFKRSNRIRNLSSRIIKYEDIDLVGYFGMESRATISGMHSQDMSRRSERSSLFEIPAQRYALVGRYQNKQVFVKKVMKRSIQLNEEIVKELHQAHYVTHVNINPYIGVCIASPNICIVSEACSRGSLSDVLANDDMKLDWTFKMSFATDITAGMEALHSSDIDFHGNLTSSNCLVDRMWVCKVADYGLRQFRTNCYQPDGSHLPSTDAVKLWMAPEHMNNNNKTKAVGSHAGDVYSYGIIFSEIVTRTEPYELLRPSTSVHEILRRIMVREVPALRPPISAGVCDSPVLKLIQQCWADEPSTRPVFRDVRKSLRKINGGRSHRLVDSMLRKMEIYSNNLEVLVQERTQQLEAEKAKTDELLYEMLPRPVADQLKVGKSVEAESFDQVTVFFSDIVGFTKLASASTPIQVVTFLNDLYTYFDNIIHNYDVYKVETIGDAYMVVSGLPEKNRDRHAGEIATMALHLLCDIRTFRIRHLPEKQPQLRVGIHTGPCVAGVVGIKKPRYDIFGDTVNVASRMESTGVPNRIHISLECKRALNNLGGYHIERRGEIELKGKGKVITYFLNGKDSFNRTRPKTTQGL